MLCGWGRRQWIRGKGYGKTAVQVEVAAALVVLQVSFPMPVAPTNAPVPPATVTVPLNVAVAGLVYRPVRFPYTGMTGSPAKIIASVNGLYGSSRNPAWVPGGSSRAR